MNSISYVKLNEVSPNELIVLLNKHKIREHLIEHELFDESRLKDWVDKKMEVNSTQGCKVRAILIGKELAGWCGIQLQDKKYEIALVIDENYWGVGTKIFKEIMIWAQNLGHEIVYIHLLHTRPESKYFRKLSKSVYQSKVLGDKFITYELAVN